MIFEKLIILILVLHFLVNFVIMLLLIMYAIYIFSKINLKSLLSKKLKTKSIVSSKKIIKYEFLSKGIKIKQIII